MKKIFKILFLFAIMFVALNACEMDDYDFQVDNDVYKLLTGTTWVDTTLISSDNYKVTQMTFNDEDSFILKIFSYVKNKEQPDSLSDCIVNMGNYTIKGDTLDFISLIQTFWNVKTGNFPVTHQEQESLYENGIFRFLKKDLKLEYKDNSDSINTSSALFHQIDE